MGMKPGGVSIGMGVWVWDFYMGFEPPDGAGMWGPWKWTEIVCFSHLQSFSAVPATIPGQYSSHQHVSPSQPVHAGGGRSEWDHIRLGPLH